jgi:glutamine cyclotransferase
VGKRTKRSADVNTQAASPAPKRRIPVVRLAFLLLVSAGLILGWTLATRATKPSNAPPVDGYQIVNTYPHDPKAFSQGLVFADGFLYEGTGLYGASTVRQVELESGKVRKYVPLDSRFFGEGITIFADEIIQLTWQKGVAVVYDKQSFKPKGHFRYSGEGWGITTDGKQLIMSDGSPTLRFLDPKTYRVVKQLTVRSGNVPVRDLNELEYVEGEIYANVWGSDRVARISPDTGQVLRWIDLAGLLKRGERRNVNAVLNGIAYDPQAKRLFVTGKLWPKLFEIRVVSRNSAERRQRSASR